MTCPTSATSDSEVPAPWIPSTDQNWSSMDELIPLDFDEDGEPTLSATPEVMDQLLEDPEDAAEIIAQVKAYLEQL